MVLNERLAVLLFGLACTMLADQAAGQVADSEFVRLPPGTFQMGSMTGDTEEQPVHLVTLTRGIWMQKTPVTQREWQSVMGANPSEHVDCLACPVENVTFKEVQAFLAALNRRSPSKMYRLPTEAEWEYAARAGSTADYGTPGALTLGGWIADNSGGTTHPVGQLRPNAWGLYDMEGNVWQWVSDWYGPYPSHPVVDPTGPASDKCGGQGCRVLRGGSCITPAAYARSAYRDLVYPRGQRKFAGFRLVRTG